jgi:hypothetical protein
MITINDVVHSFRLATTSFDKKSYMTYIKSYMKAVKAYLLVANPERVPIFEKKVCLHANETKGISLCQKDLGKL